MRAPLIFRFSIYNVVSLGGSNDLFAFETVNYILNSLVGSRRDKFSLHVPAVFVGLAIHRHPTPTPDYEVPPTDLR